MDWHPSRTIVFLGADADYMYRFRLPLIQAFARDGWRAVVVATPVAAGDAAQFETAGVAFVPWSLARAELDPIADAVALRQLWRVLRRERPAIVFTHTVKPVIYGQLLARAARVPRRVAMLPGLGFAFIGGRGGRRRIVAMAGRLGYRAALGTADLVIFQNRDDRETLRALGALPPRTGTALVAGSGIDLQRFTIAPLPEGPTTFLMVARMLRDKGVGEFVEAARRVRARLPSARFVLVGAPDDNPASVDLADKARWEREGIVEMRGHLPDPRPELAACHVFVLPSYREGLPRTNLEAMATGRAVITTDVPGCRETVVDGLNGLLVPPRDPGALAAAMLRLATDTEAIARMGAAGRRMCEERFELSAVIADTKRLMLGAGGGVD